MKQIVCLAVIAIATLISPPAKADSPDPLWLKVIEQNKEIKKWPARALEQEFVVTESGKEPSKIIIKKEFEKIEKGAVIYKVVSTSPETDVRKLSTIDLEEQFVKEEEQLVFSPKAKVKRINDQTIDGRITVTFEIQASDSIVKLWVDGEDGKIYRRVIEISIPLVLEGNIETNYGPNPDGNHVLQRTVSTLSIKIPFNKKKIQTIDKFYNWSSQK